jgi:hypothetical protein
MLYTGHWCIGQCAVLLRVSKLTLSACKTKSFSLRNFSTDGHKLNMLNDTSCYSCITTCKRNIDPVLRINCTTFQRRVLVRGFDTQSRGPGLLQAMMIQCCRGND